MKKGTGFFLGLFVTIVSCTQVSQDLSRADKIAAQIHNPESDYVVVVCHRGDWRNFPENSIPAIESIIRMGADIMELDLKMTKDSVLVLSHDATLNRCSTGKGAISDYTYEELQKFSLKRAHGIAIDSIKYPTLREALETCKDRICVNIDQGYEFYDQIIPITEELGVTNQILIKGKNAIDVVAEHESHYSNNMMYMPIVDIQTESGKALLESYLTSGTVPLAYEVCWQNNDGTFEDVCKKIIGQGAKVWVNTIWASLCGGNGNDDDAVFINGNPDEIYGRYLDLGVSMIQTDRPQQLIGYLKSKGRHSL